MVPEDENGRPKTGYYLVRLVKKGWAVAAEIHVEDGRYFLTVDGEDQGGQWPVERFGRGLLEWLGVVDADIFGRVLQFGEPCDEATYLHRLAVKDWALNHSPQHPAATPWLPINLRTVVTEEF